jgi:hypothetical protein
MNILQRYVLLGLIPCAAAAQTVPAPVPENEVFKREEIGHALAAPTPGAGHTAPSAANAPQDDRMCTRCNPCSVFPWA